MNTTAQATTNSNTVASNNQPRTDEIIIGEFGNGRYSPLMAECYESLKTCLGLPDEKADRIARKIASDFGAHTATKGVSLEKVKIGKVNKDNKVTLKEAGMSVKGVTLTWGLHVLKTLLYIADAGQNGVQYSGTKWAVTESLQKSIDNICKKAN